MIFTDEENELDLFSDKDDWRYNLQRLEELNRLNSYERTDFTITLVLLFYSLILLSISWDSSSVTMFVSIVFSFVLTLILTFRLIAIFTNDLESRIESFGVESFFLLMFFIILVTLTLLLRIRPITNELVIAPVLSIVGFTVGFLFAYLQIDDRINSFINSQLYILHREVELEKDLFDFERIETIKHWEKLLWAFSIVGLLIPLLLYYIFKKIDVKEAYLFLYLGIIILVFITIIFTVGMIYLKKRS